MAHRTSRVSPCVLMSVVCAGCFPVGWAIPPTKLDTGVGVASRTYKDSDTGDAVSSRTSGAFDVRGSIEPLAALPDLEDRVFDVSAGYGLRYAWTRGYITHGPFIGASVLVPVGERVGRRITLGSQLHALLGRRAQGTSIVGNRLTGRIGFEWSRWEAGPFDGCAFDDDGGFCGGGLSFGELGFSPYTEISRAQLSGGTEWAWTFGITLRLPASIGGGLVFINPLSLI